MEEILKDNQWIGEFFLPDQYDKRFFGKVDYSPENGVILSYSITGLNVPSDTDIIHGVLENHERCTLIGKFPPSQSGISIKKRIRHTSW